MRIYFTILLFFVSCLAIKSQPNGTAILDYDNPKEYEISGLTISGITHLDPNIVTSLSGLYVGKKIEIPGDAISESIKRLWRQGLFGNISISILQVINNKVFLEIKVVELPHLAGFYFTGLKKAEIEDIKGKLGITRGRILTKGIESDVQAQVENHLIDKGFMDAKCYTRQLPDSSIKNGVLLAIDAKRGERTRIAEISFLGNYNITDRKLKRIMRDTKETNKFSIIKSKDERELSKKDLAEHYTLKERFENLSVSSVLDMVDKRFRLRLFSTSKFIKKDYIKDRDALVQTFYDKGYRDATIVSDTVYKSDNHNLKINILIDEGRKYYFRNIEFRGNTKYKSEDLQRVVGIRAGDVYNSSLLEMRLRMDPSGQDISSLYMDDGYLFFNLQPEEQVIGIDSVDVVVNIFEGTQATVDRIIITGNSKTKEAVIRREIRTKPGSKFSRSDIIRTQRDLAALGFFDPERIEILPKPHPEKGTVDIEYKVEEKSNDQLNVSAGYGGRDPLTSRERFNITLGVVFNNFSGRDMFRKKGWNPIPAGDGERLSLNVNTTGQSYQAVQIGYTKPWFGGKRPNTFNASFNSGFFRNLADATILSNDNYFFNLNGTVGLGWRLKWPDDFFNLYTGISLKNYQLKNFTQYLNNNLVKSGTFTNPNFVFELSRSNVDGGGIFPKSGTEFNISFNPSVPLSLMPWNQNKNYEQLGPEERFRWLEFHKTRFNIINYTKLVGNLVLKTAIKTGYIGFFNKEYGNTPFDLFQLGDVTNFQGNQGFQGRDFIQLRGHVGSVTDIRGNGFEIFNKFTMELRYPFSLNPNSTIFGLAFIEGGNGWHNMKEYNPLLLKRSAGVGVRFFLPMFGLIGIDYGVRFDPTSVGDLPINRNKGLLRYIGDYGHINFMLGFEPE